MVIPVETSRTSTVSDYTVSTQQLITSTSTDLDWTEILSSTELIPSVPTLPAGLRHTQRNREKLERARQRLVELLAYPADWNGPSSAKIDHDTVTRALKFLTVWFLLPGAAEPSIVPRAEGGVQVEWHIRGSDFELHFLPNQPIGFFLSSPGSESEGNASQNLWAFLQMLGKLVLTAFVK